MGLFNSLFGKDKKNTEKTTEGQKKEIKAEVKTEKKPVEKSEEELAQEKLKKSLEAIYDKSYVCPVCENKFRSKTMRTGKFKLVNTDLDLKPYFEPIHAEYYDIVLCGKCGYAASSNQFGTLRDFQVDFITKEISKDFTDMEYSDIYTAEEALFRYKQALKCNIAKKGKDSEKAYLELRIAWIYRDIEDKTSELKYIRASYEDFVRAIANEYYPMSGLDEFTVMYILANLSYELGNNEMAKRLLGKILGKTDISDRMKEKIQDFRELLKNG